MKFTKLFAAALCIATVATACQEPIEEPTTPQGKAINLAIDVDNFTKATDTSFENGDQIGLHIVPGGVYLNNAKYTYTDGALVGEQTNYWYMDETTESDIYAYYPYNETATYKAAGCTFTVNADQSKAGAFTASDLMVAATSSKPTAESIVLPFRHAFSKIVIKIDNQLEEAIEDVYFSEVYGTATVNYKSGEVTTSGSKGTIKTAKVTVAGEPAYAVIVAPQQNVTPKLIIKTTSQQYTYELSGEISFSSGKVSTAAITISDQSIATAFTPTITDWVGDNDLQFGQGESGDNNGEGGNNDGGSTEGENTIYLHPGVWDVDGAWFSAHVWGDGDKDITLTDNDGDGVYECAVSVATTGVLFCRMNSAYTEFSWDEGHVWNQTEDLTIGVAPNNHYYITGWGTDKSEGVWSTSDYVVDTPAVSSGLGVVGSFAASNWSEDILLYATDAAGVLVAKDIVFNAYDAFKIRTAGTWEGEVNLGAGEINYFKANRYFAVYNDGGDILVEAAGTYDIYFDKNASKVYLMSAGVDYTTATEQTTDGAAPDPSTMTWGLCGEHNGWGGTDDTVLTWDGTIGLFVAKGVALTGQFKVRADSSWTTNFGGASITVDSASAASLTNNGNNCTVAAGTYDVYFWYNTDNIKANAKLWVKTVGSAAPSL